MEQTWDRCRPPCSQPLGPPPGTLPSENHQDSTNPPKPGAFLLSTHFSGRKWPCIQLGKQSRPLSCHGRTPASKGRVPTDTESAGLHRHPSGPPLDTPYPHPRQGASSAPCPPPTEACCLFLPPRAAAGAPTKPCLDSSSGFFSVPTG